MLKVGDYLFTQGYTGEPVFAKVISVNKNTYRIVLLSGEETTIGIKSLKGRICYGGEHVFVPLDASQLTNKVISSFLSREALNKKISEINQHKELLGQAKYFLEQLKGIDSIMPVDDYPDCYDAADDDWEDDDWYIPEDYEPVTQEDETEDSFTIPDYSSVEWDQVFTSRTDIPPYVCENGYECPAYGVITFEGKEYPVYTDDYGCQDFIVYPYEYQGEQHEHFITVQNMGGMLDWDYELTRMINTYEKDKKED